MAGTQKQSEIIASWCSFRLCATHFHSAGKVDGGLLFSLDWR